MRFLKKRNLCWEVYKFEEFILIYEAMIEKKNDLLLAVN